MRRRALNALNLNYGSNYNMNLINILVYIVLYISVFEDSNY